MGTHINNPYIFRPSLHDKLYHSSPHMKSPQEDRPRSLKALCEAVITNKLGEGGRRPYHKKKKEEENEEEEVKRSLETLFGSGNPVLSGLPAVKGLRDAVRLFVKKHAYLIKKTGGNDVVGVRNEPVNLRDALLSNHEAMENIREEWKEILENMYAAEEDDSTTPPGETLATDTTPQSNVLFFDAGHTGAWEELQLEEKSQCSDARGFLETCVREWMEEGLPIEKGKAEAFVRALREVIDTELDSIVFDDHWESWVSSLLMCVEPRAKSSSSTSWEVLTLVELIYSRCTPQRKLLLLDFIADKIQQPFEDALILKDFILQLFHRILLCTAEYIVGFMDDEIARLVLKSLRVTADHLASFDMMDPQAKWLKHILVRPSVVRDLASLSSREPELINKLTAAMPAPHAVELMLIMLPLWVKGPGDELTSTRIFDKLVDALLNKHMLDDLVEDAMACVDRCLCGLHTEKRHEHFHKVHSFLLSQEYSEVQESVGRLLRLLLCFSIPSTYDPDKSYRLLPMHLRSLEEGLLRRLEKWTRKNATLKIVVGDFWWEILRWHAADLPKVAAHAVRAVCRDERRVGSPWDEGHLVAISYSVSSWRGLEEVLEDEQRAGSLNYVALLLNICACASRASSRLQQERQQQQQQQQPPMSLNPTACWLLMRWCTNACARRGLFLATTEVLRSLTDDRDVTEGSLLAIPVEEFDSITHMPHAIPAQELSQKRMLATILSVRLWIATLCPLSQTPSVAELDVTGKLAQQLQTYWVDYDSNVSMPDKPFGEDSLLLLLCVLSMNKLTRVRKSGSHSQEYILQDALKRLLAERRGHDPVWHLLQFLITGVGSDHLAAIIVHRFGTAQEVPLQIDVDAYETSVLHDVGEKELGTMKDLIGLKKGDKERETHVLPVLQLLLQLNGGDVSHAVAAFKKHPTSRWETYGRCMDLAASVVERLLKSFPYLEERMRCEGVDVYYLSLLCIRRWLRDSVKLPDLARASIDKFMRLGQVAWEGLVADSLGRHIEALWEQFSEADGLLRLCAESVILPVSPFLVLCLATDFILKENV
ncbi:hypothetical protein MOQ_000597 [Trypanosoma cruzi marinkellei]|uniref:Uncharacterized protein n=1 Tax=Trypanosoma cruzi marinkellei TaxID=85056 RepID=K2MVD7_TRYCR|nr:hypothetical protein MOQ_000597 [Trypanosoma cruzi marinkellei]